MGGRRLKRANPFTFGPLGLRNFISSWANPDYAKSFPMFNSVEEPDLKLVTSLKAIIVEELKEVVSELLDGTEPRSLAVQVVKQKVLN